VTAILESSDFGDRRTEARRTVPNRAQASSVDEIHLESFEGADQPRGAVVPESQDIRLSSDPQGLTSHPCVCQRLLANETSTGAS
jgi:hypothetical protein